MLNAVLLDLDNTLILYDEPGFYIRYFEYLDAVFEDLMTAAELRRRIMAAVAGLQHTDGRHCNRDHFVRRFAEGLTVSESETWKRFQAFYADIYPGIPVSVRRSAGGRALVDRIRAHGLKLVIATNPLFPLCAQHTRLRWAGLADIDFDLVTDIENMAHVKPHAGYFREICQKIGMVPEVCLMVGNDAVNDMAAGRIGMITYHTTDAARIDYRGLRGASARPAPPDRPPMRPPDHSGLLADAWPIIERRLEMKPA